MLFDNKLNFIGHISTQETAAYSMLGFTYYYPRILFIIIYYYYLLLWNEKHNLHMLDDEFEQFGIGCSHNNNNVKVHRGLTKKIQQKTTSQN